MDLSFNSTRNFSLFHQKPNKQRLFRSASASLLLASALDSGEKKNPKVGFNLPRVFPFIPPFSPIKNEENFSTPSAVTSSRSLRNSSASFAAKRSAAWTTSGRIFGAKIGETNRVIWKLTLWIFFGSDLQGECSRMESTLITKLLTASETSSPWAKLETGGGAA